MTNREYSMTIPKNIRKVAIKDYNNFCEKLSNNLGVTVKTVKLSYVKMEDYSPQRLHLYQKDICDN